MPNNNGQQPFDANEIVRIMRNAVKTAESFEHEYVTLEHLLHALTVEPKILDILKQFNIKVGDIQDELLEYLESDLIPKTHNGATPEETIAVSSLIKISVAHVMLSGRHVATANDLLLGLLRQDDGDCFATRVLISRGLDEASLKMFLAHGPGGGVGTKGSPMTTGPDGEQRIKDVTNKEEAIALLEKFTTNLNKVAEDGNIDSVIGRETEIQEIVQVMARRSKNNVVMVGEPGVGKTAIAEGLALKIFRKEVPEIIQGSVVYSLNIGDLVAGTRFRGDFEERIKFILKALTFVDSPILFIDEIHMIMGAGSGKDNSMDVANLLKPAFTKGYLRCIGSTTFEEYRKHFEKDRALVRRFEKLDINEPDIASAKLIMRGLKTHYEKHHGVTYTDEALDQAVEMTARFVQNKFLPDKAIDVIDRAGARQRVKPEETKEKVITEDHILFEVAKIAKIPEQTVGTDERAKLVSLEKDLKAAVYGQDSAIDTLVDAVIVARAGLRDDNKPAGSFLFVGPTGVGKTETARQLASTLGVPLVKFDMSEYAEKHSVAKLIGAPPGYVGHGEGGAGSGLLTNEIETKPHCVLLLDEVEKAHPDIFNTFLQVMDDGKLTNSSGKTVYFNNVTLILTSNAGAREASKNTLGFNGPATKVGAEDSVIKDAFSPEFRNRLDAIVKFKGLGKELLVKVVNKFVGRISKQLESREMKFEISDEAVEWLANKDIDPMMGARPVERVVNDHVKRPVSKAMIFQGAKKGDTIKVELEADAIKVTIV
jgi:ATP-dependent Clp protease ATP-binding subunit ClpA